MCSRFSDPTAPGGRVTARPPLLNVLMRCLTAGERRKNCSHELLGFRSALSAPPADVTIWPDQHRATGLDPVELSPVAFSHVKVPRWTDTKCGERNRQFTCHLGAGITPCFRIRPCQQREAGIK